MPHISILMYPGRSDAIKKDLAKKLQQTVVDTLGVDPRVTTVSIEDVPKEQWPACLERYPKDTMIIDR